ncbi:quinol oxidase subunit 2 [Sulfolobus sp. A20]|uniref:quinol oxidase subunit 2 n=1 Tax=Sulfolobaceae TaxID=118883 RepID=UPI0008462340|nr:MULTISPECIES: quinol oxidase subunit 2 [unclassified Sulfolobus]TRM75220.1 quinol oxidase subunit 2 [Sulfolobus sp. A20-N-F8]TRM83572.1 quinol oxidase subunit 2 [Sulfolobus sp. A20-N-F6]TRM83615.1 quinol oxidase subunit 2 [Sulfolobus sp. F3]TRM95316.1 quinol oxidase subunit 2 [Sulfolobus sp. A20-N-G8]TRM97316.1 quinol oxidase subunit 2 [Sulfolobus sp. E1]TRN03421.1 quinol oxidase subunit 2 [Sulfolobus sp. F1]
MSKTSKKLTGKDYAWWVISVLGFFVLFLWIGDFGRLSYLTQSPLTNYVENLWSVTYIAAGGVFAIFMGSIVFLSVRFRAPPEAVTTGVSKRVSVTTYYYMTLFIDLVMGIVVTYEMFTIASQFTIGLLASADLFIFASIIYLIYKLYFED